MIEGEKVLRSDFEGFSCSGASHSVPLKLWCIAALSVLWMKMKVLLTATILLLPTIHQTLSSSSLIFPFLHSH